ncbi:hypothetical protein E4H12_06480 [Candidatus Thorarchaeota archaeon]|nr:MAG: hypothetical protein E4H12_06480 [Candidatus Thorarchaeota archaeon]
MKVMSWNDRFALIDHYKPTDAAIRVAFNVDQNELETARGLRSAGTFTANPQFDCSKHNTVFAVGATSDGDGVAKTTSKSTSPRSDKDTVVTGSKVGSATVHTKPESATKKAKVPQKRGRKGDKIHRALQAVTTTPIAVDSFIKQYGVSLAVLRQSKRFLEKMDAAAAKKIGKINVRQDKASKQLMIWREDA